MKCQKSDRVCIWKVKSEVANIEQTNGFEARGCASSYIYLFYTS